MRRAVMLSCTSSMRSAEWLRLFTTERCGRIYKTRVECRRRSRWRLPRRRRKRRSPELVAARARSIVVVVRSVFLHSRKLFCHASQAPASAPSPDARLCFTARRAGDPMRRPADDLARATPPSRRDLQGGARLSRQCRCARLAYHDGLGRPAALRSLRHDGARRRGRAG